MYLLLHLPMHICVKFFCLSNLYSLSCLSVLPSILSLQNIWPHFIHKTKKKGQTGLTRRSRLHISTWDKSTKNMRLKWMAADGQTGQTQDSRTMQPFSLLVLCSYQHLQTSFSLSCGLQEQKSEQAVNQSEWWLEENPVIVLKAAVTLPLSQSLMYLLLMY